MTTASDHAGQIHEFLCRPAAYPDRPQSIELKETHISWLYLTDRHVYKQKKPVSFEFLDFSTLERRKHFCEQEVMLNQRFSPDVYLGVVPVSCDKAGKYQLKRGQHVVEWVVKMKRLDESSTLENLIQFGSVTASDIQRLAEQLSGFYLAQAPAMIRSEEFLHRLSRHVAANRLDLLGALADDEDAILAAIQFATNGQLRCLALESEYFVQRVADGRVVDGHGDLRPEHVYFHRSKVEVIDCVEFSAEYRINDVVDELAFLAMECDRLGRPDVGAALFATYSRLGTDEFKPFLAAFYKCYRACVRAKVSALRAAQSKGAERIESVTRSRSYVEAAKRYAEELGGKLVIVVGGLSGTGKSTLAAALQLPLAAEVLQTDVVRGELFDQPDADNGKYTLAGRTRVYDTIIDRMESSLSRSPTLILDGTFSTTAARQAVAARAKQLGAKLLQVQCECPAAAATARIAQRVAVGNSPSEATPELHVKQRAEYDAVAPNLPLVTVNTLESGPEQTDVVIDAVRALLRF